MRKIILASSSPRRAEILENLGIAFDIIPSDYDEPKVNKSPEELVCYYAKNKALNVACKSKEDDIIIAADTIVTIDDTIIGKPKSKEDAFNILSRLSGKEHNVITGIYIICSKAGLYHGDYEKTKVFFKNLSHREIWDYINTEEPMDKAGAYGIQGLGGLFVEKIEGNYYNVVGLPINKIYSVLRDWGVNLIAEEV